MADPLKINETGIGTLVHTGNEVLNYSKNLDPAAYRGGAPEDQRSLVKFSGDVLEDGRGHEVVLMQFKQSGDNVPDGKRGGEFYLGLAKPGEGSTDDAMKDMLIVTPTGFYFNAPIYAPNFNNGADPIPPEVSFPIPVSPNPIPTENNMKQFTTTDGKYLLIEQGDGNVVVYLKSSMKPLWDKFSYEATNPNP